MIRARPIALGVAALLGSLLLRSALSARPSLHMHAIKAVLHMKKRPVDLADIEHTARTRAYPQPAPITASLRTLCDVKERQVDGSTIYLLTPRKDASEWHVIYTHGGAYVHPLLRNHWDLLEALIRSTGASVTVPLYPLAPDHTFEAAYMLLETVYRDLLTRMPAERVMLCGDSAGGALALGQAIRYRDACLPQPGRVVLFAPWLDLSLSDPRIREVEPRDVMLRIDTLRLVGRWWAGNTNPQHPWLSPLRADLTGLSPIDVFQGTDDLFIVDTRTFHRQALEAGADVRLYETPGGFHVFMAVPGIPEAKDVYKQIARNLSLSRGVPT